MEHINLLNYSNKTEFIYSYTKESSDHLISRLLEQETIILTDTDTLVIRMHLELNRMIRLRREITVNGDECERCSK